MLILTGDDFGRDRSATDACMECFRLGRITTASIMVFMEDSERAAELSIKAKLETGLHLNFVLPYNSPEVPEHLRKSHRSTIRFFQVGPWTQVVYNPFIAKTAASVFRAQLDEYRRLFGKEPAYFNGHKHLHLSLNMVLANHFPPGSTVRRSFTFFKGEKNLLNRSFRRIVDKWLRKRFITTDGFFSLSPVEDFSRLLKIISLARNAHIELMVHPWRPNEFALLTGEAFKELLASVRLGRFELLTSKKNGECWPTGNNRHTDGKGHYRS